ncbi:MAG TPA: nicotinate-nucleotide adenylyltransferase [Dehalococcoidia bacterium]|nr:nicotinate-nucleotide adenylyltransferase [Dehalococcoidia bacterium]
MKIGVLGGTFDPVHIGHLAVADEVKARLGLAEVLFIPTGQPWFKADVGILPAEYRLEMVRLAIAGKPGLELSDMEIKREGPTYTVDTIAELRRQSSGEDELYFIVGWDKLTELPGWRQPECLVSMCRLVAVPRVGCPVPDLDALEGAIPGISQRVVMLDKPQIDVSASIIRQRVRRGLPISRLVPEAVERYIREKGLYRG